MSAGFSWKWRAITPFWLRSKHWLIRHHHTWIKRPPEQKFSRNKAEPHTSNKWAPRAAHGAKEKVGGPSGRPADLPMDPTASSLRRGSSSLDGEVSSRSCWRCLSAIFTRQLYSIIKENCMPYSHICITNLAPQLFSSFVHFRWAGAE